MNVVGSSRNALSKLTWNGSSWDNVPDGEVQQALDDKAYIDMPNLGFRTFLNPRRITLGLRFRF